MIKTLKEIRKSKRLTQSQAADMLKVSLRSYKTYENEPEKKRTIKYQYMISVLDKYMPIDEEHGILLQSDISEACKEVFKDYEVHYAYLFGSYAKGKANEKSDVDLLVATDVTGLKFFGLVEKLRNSLHKNVDVLNLKQLIENQELLNEILKDGVKIYG